MDTSDQANMSRNSTKITRVNYSPNLEVYAPLNERDSQAMAELFDREDSDEIETDINSKLQMVIPEPCWEDDTLGRRSGGVGGVGEWRRGGYSFFSMPNALCPMPIAHCPLPHCPLLICKISEFLQLIGRFPIPV